MLLDITTNDARTPYQAQTNAVLLMLLCALQQHLGQVHTPEARKCPEL